MLALITALAEAAAAALRIWAVNAQYNLRRRIETDIEADENEITTLRARGDDASQRAADKLLNRIIRAQGIAANLPAESAPTQGGAAGANGSGSLHPSGR